MHILKIQNTPSFKAASIDVNEYKRQKNQNLLKGI